MKTQSQNTIEKSVESSKALHINHIDSKSLKMKVFIKLKEWILS